MEYLEMLESIGVWQGLIVIVVLATIAYVFKLRDSTTSTLTNTIDKQTAVQEQIMKSIKETNKEIKDTTISTLTSVKELSAKVETAIDIIKDLLKGVNKNE